MRTRLLLATLATLATLACVKPRNILEPVSGAFETAYPDSAHYVLEAAAYAVTDYAVPIVQYDKRRRYLETRYIDVANFPATVSREGYMGNERLVKFQFRAVPTFGATRLIGEVIYQPAGGTTRAMERMVPAEHVGREMLARLYQRTEERLVRERAERAERKEDN